MCTHQFDRFCIQLYCDHFPIFDFSVLRLFTSNYLYRLAYFELCIFTTVLRAFYKYGFAIGPDSSEIYRSPEAEVEVKL